jgi:hypothetical protein
MDAQSVDKGLVVQWMFGAAVVLLYAADRFRKPGPIRSTTTFWRYWTAAFGYAAAMLALFILLGGGIGSVELRDLAPLIGEIPDEMASLPGPLLSAMALTSLLPHLPLLARIDETIRQWFWDVGNIPSEVRLLANHLVASRYASGVALPAPAAVQAFKAYGADPLWLGQAEGSFKLRWSQCVALLGQLERWDGERGYCRFLDQNKVALADLRERAVALSQLLNAGTLNELDGSRNSDALSYLRKTTDRDIAVMWRGLCTFAAGGVLNETWNDKQRRIALARLGFSGLPQESSPLNSNDIVLVVGLVFIAMLFIPLAIRRFFDHDMLPPDVRVLVMVPIVYAIAIVAAIYPKSVWRGAARSEGGQRPFAAYALSAVGATVAAFFISLLFRFAFDSNGTVFDVLAKPGAFGQAWHTSVERWPWLLMSFFATLSIAWAADDFHGTESVVPKWLRWVEAAALCAVFTLAQWAVIQLLIGISTGHGPSWPELQRRMLITAGAIGACIGFLVPSLYRARNAPRHAAPTTAGNPPRLVARAIASDG